MKTENTLYAQLLLCMTLLLVSACGSPSAEPTGVDASGSKNGQKDLQTFELASSVTEAAPKMQAHLLRLLPYNSPRFQTKPHFVFLDEDQESQGQSSFMVSRLNLVHAAYYQKETLIWSGSLLLAVRMGATVFSRTGQKLAMIREDGGYRFQFVDGQTTFEINLIDDRDREHWFEAGNTRLYIHYYVFPETLVIQGGETAQDP